jgi:hypothetical protein
MLLPTLFRLWADIAVEIAGAVLPEGRAVANARAAVDRNRAAAQQRAEAERFLDRAARHLAEAAG